MIRLGAELYYSGAWHDITEDVRVDPGVAIVRGRRDWAQDTDPCTCSMRFNNGASDVAPGIVGRYSPDNPNSDLYGLLGRNTRVRIRKGTPAGNVALAGAETDYLSTPDVASLDVTGDIDIRIEADPDAGWRTAASLARKYLTTGDQRSWALWVDSAGVVNFRWSPDGTLAAAISTASTAAVPDDDARRAIRVILDVDNGAGGKTVTFYTADTITGTWTQLGASLSGAGTTSVFASTATVELGRLSTSGISIDAFAGRIHAFQLRNGIAGPAVADLDIAGDAEPGDTTITDGAGRVWTLQGSADVNDPALRFVGEIAALPPEWDTSGRDSWVTVSAAGMLRRLQQGRTPVASAPRRFISSLSPLSYWPLEDGKAAVRGQNLVNVRHPMKLDFTDGPEPLMWGEGLLAYWLPATLKADTADTTGVLVGKTPHTGSLGFIVEWTEVLATPGSSQFIAWLVYTSGAPEAVTVNFAPGPETIALTFGGGGVGPTAFPEAFDANPHHYRLHVQQNGANLEYFLYLDAELALSGSQAVTIAGMSAVGHNYLDAQTRPMVLGHFVVWEVGDHPDVEDSYAAAFGWPGETAGRRIIRICAENNIPLVFLGDADDTEPMGPQGAGTPIELIRECARADLGILAEPADRIGLSYRARTDMYGVQPRGMIEIDYAAEEIRPQFKPVTDDQATRNDVLARRIQGGEYRAQQLTGPLSVADPPDGAGVYDTVAELNVDADAQLPDQASFRVHLGTVLAARYPTVRVNITTVPRLAGPLQGLRFGDRIRVINPPAYVPPGPIDLIVQGLTEEDTAGAHTEIELMCTPAEPWEIGVWDDDTDPVSRYDTGGSTLAADISDTATSLTITTTTGPVWTTDAGEMPLDIIVGGEVMTVTAVAGTTSPQTFTVTRSTNGIVKAHTAGADVALADPVYYGL